MHDVFVLPGAMFEMPGWFRISVTANDDMVERALPGFAKAIAGGAMSTYAFLGAGEFEDWHADVDRVLLDGRGRQDAGVRDGRGARGRRRLPRLDHEGRSSTIGRSASTLRLRRSAPRPTRRTRR